MGIKTFIKKYCPQSLLPLLKTPYHRMKIRIIEERAKKYLPYYQDELSREILNDRIEYLKSGDKSIFLKRAEKSGMHFYHIYDVKEGHDMYEDKYSGFIVIYDQDSMELEYTKKLLKMCKYLPKYRFYRLDDFMKNCDVSDSELIVMNLRHEDMKRLEEYLSERKICNDTVTYIVAVRKDLQYLEMFSPAENETIIDAGCFNGATALRFIKWGGEKVRRVYTFEFDPVNIARCEKNLRGHEDIVKLVKKGTWDKDEVMYTNPNGSGGSSVYSEGSIEINLTSIDNVVKDDAVTFIELDVEGAELRTLKGARNTIIKHHPRLAISAYHKPEDIYELPEYILSLVPEYKFYMRHYSSREWETVLYASVN
ncbi:MAG: FkbM family methyltransferase [Synergistaceae bacterium]|nr:FkbM family methyltransferase [Synergistaceae bacterium]MBQ3450602.1 FkbM family methyltransferase [Synergistaceae bacterium]MBQ3695032.1 FkbM family methyltransferase [Synergistaceae bacterium]MBQ6112292.1 FkbM family methyltransferase [Synergistaceae bacterium]MBQ9628573.1 FkbM family methyltransferase [Synergistaceae bacterium]